MSISRIIQAHMLVMALLTFATVNEIAVARDIESNLHKQTMFDWYVATPTDRLATAVHLLGKVVPPENQQDFARFRYMANTLVDCIDKQMVHSDSRLVANAAEVCLLIMKSDGVLR